LVYAEAVAAITRQGKMPLPFGESAGIVQSEERLRIGVMSSDERSGASFFMQKTPYG
jgi:hypothetical protein